MVLAHCEEICWNKKVFERERAGRGMREGPRCRGFPTPGWFLTLYLRRWSIHSPHARVLVSAHRELQTAPARASAPHSVVGTQHWDTVICFYPSTHLHSTGLGNCVTTQRWVFKTDQAGSTALHIQLRCTHQLPSLCAGKWAAKDFFLEIAFGAGTFLHRQDVQTLSLGSTCVG